MVAYVIRAKTTFGTLNRNERINAQAIVVRDFVPSSS